MLENKRLDDDYCFIFIADKYLSRYIEYIPITQSLTQSLTRLTAHSWITIIILISKEISQLNVKKGT